MTLWPRVQHKNENERGCTGKSHTLVAHPGTLKVQLEGRCSRKKTYKHILKWCLSQQSETADDEYELSNINNNVCNKWKCYFFVMKRFVVQKSNLLEL